MYEQNVVRPEQNQQNSGFGHDTLNHRTGTQWVHLDFQGKEEGETFFAEAVFAIQNGNEMFLQLLLGPGNGLESKQKDEGSRGIQPNNGPIENMHVDHLIQSIMRDMTESNCMPPRYMSLLNDKIALAKLLKCASIAFVNVTTLDSQQKSLLFYSLQTNYSINMRQGISEAEKEQKLRVQLNIIKLLLRYGANSTMSMPLDNQLQPYSLVVIFGDNGVNAIIRDYFFRNIVHDIQSSSIGFQDKKMIEELKNMQMAHLINFLKDLYDFYEKTSTSEPRWYDSEELRALQLDICKRMITEVVPHALATKSCHITIVMSSGMVNQLKPYVHFWTINRGELSEIFERHIRGAKALFADVDAIATMAQLQTFMDCSAAQRELIETDGNSVISSLVKQTEMLKNDLAAANERADNEKLEKEKAVAENQSLVVAHEQRERDLLMQIRENTRTTEYLLSENKQRTFEGHALESKVEKLQKTIELLLKMQDSNKQGNRNDKDDKSKQENKHHDNISDAPKSPRSTPGYDAQQEGTRSNSNDSSQQKPGAGKW